MKQEEPLMEDPVEDVLDRLSVETVRQLNAIVCRWLGDPEEKLDRLLLSMVNNPEFQKGVTGLVLKQAVEKMRPAMRVFSATMEARLRHRDPERGESYLTRPPMEHLGQLKKKVTILESVLKDEDSKRKAMMVCIDIAVYAMFVALTRGEMGDFIAKK